MNKGEGSVEIADQGTFNVIQQRQNGLVGYDPTLQKLELDGEALRGRFTLEHIRGEEWVFGAVD